MVSIELQQLRLHGYHGIYPGEDKVGSPYEISLKVLYHEGRTDFSDLRDTINYAELFEIVRQRMQIPTPLLEKLADGIIRKIKHQYPQTREVVFTIYKLEPPIEGIQGRVGITLHKHFDE